MLRSSRACCGSTQRYKTGRLEWVPNTTLPQLYRSLQIPYVRCLREAWAMAQLSEFLQRAGIRFLASLSEASSPGKAPCRSSDSKGQHPNLRRSPHLQTQHPANRQFQTSQPSPAQTPLLSSYWFPVKGRNNVIGFPISLPLALQDLGGSWRRPPLSISEWRALIGLGTAQTCPRRFLQTLGRETLGGGAEPGVCKPGVCGV